MKPALFLFFLAILFGSCEKCNSCFLIKTTNSISSETPVGERCDADIKTLENQDLVCLADDCHYECR